MSRTARAGHIARYAAAAAMSENELQHRVRELAAGLGLWHYHVWNSSRSEPGWPDSVIIGSRVLFRELKTERGRLTAEQRDVGERLQRAGQDWAVWRPRDLYDGTITRQLTAITVFAQPQLWDQSERPAETGRHTHTEG